MTAQLFESALEMHQNRLKASVHRYHLQDAVLQHNLHQVLYHVGRRLLGIVELQQKEVRHATP
ncbi:MAG: hypothetical protein R3C14_00550 [Caldilineaceae bacterium]